MIERAVLTTQEEYITVKNLTDPFFMKKKSRILKKYLSLFQAQILTSIK